MLLRDSKFDGKQYQPLDFLHLSVRDIVRKCNLVVKEKVGLSNPKALCLRGTLRGARDSYELTLFAPKITFCISEGVLYYRVYTLQRVAGNRLGGRHLFLIVLAQLQVTCINAFSVIYLLKLTALI